MIKTGQMRRNFTIGNANRENQEFAFNKTFKNER